MHRIAATLTVTLISFLVATGTADARQGTTERRPVDLAICLDVSGSMEHLLNSVRGRIWDIVTELSHATPTPRLRVALVTFGGEEAADEGYIVQHVDFTDDLDSAYAKLMALHTGGSEEYVGWAIESSVTALNWSSEPEALRVMVVAGNESANQGVDEHDFRTSGELAAGRDILINSVYAGQRENGISEKWDRVALAGNGTYSAIDVVRGTIQVETPYDSELAELNEELNRTYLPYGPKGNAGLANQVAQDRNARSMGAQSCSSRVAAKGCALYDTSSWDLVDAVQRDGFRLEDVNVEELPSFMRTLSVDERSAYISRMKGIRDLVGGEITRTNEKRQTYIRNLESERRAEGRSFDDALIASLRSQAIAKGFKFPEPVQGPEPRMTVNAAEPMPSSPKLNDRARAKVDEILDALPVLEFGVSHYRTRRRALAERFAEGSASDVRYHVGDRVFDAESKATDAITDRLRGRMEELSSIRVNEVPATMVFAGSGEAVVGEPTYLIGGFEFPERAMAERVRDDIRAALDTDRAPGSRSGDRAELVSLEDEGSCRPRPGIEYYREGIKIIAETAAVIFMKEVDGC